MRRARGNGGRFLNTKKLEHNNPNATLEKGDSAGANSSTSPPAATQYLLTSNGNQGSSNIASQCKVQYMHKVQSLCIGYHDGNGFTALCHSQANGKQEGDFFGKERDPNGAIK